MQSFKQYSKSQKRQKLSAFNHVYFEGDPQNWKISRLPDWMHFYGVQLSKELSREAPRYHKRFKQGTIVMVNYGVPIGDELGGKHFGVVLSNDDNKHKKKILVVPLSSHYHRDYANLGYELMDGILELLNDRINELKTQIDNHGKEIKDFIAVNGNKTFNFTDEEVNFFQKNNINVSNILDKHTVFWFEFKDENYKKLIEAVKNIDIKENYPNIFELISHTNKIKDFISGILKDILNEQKNVHEIVGLTKKLSRYNKYSYAVITDIRSVSKSRITKLSHYTISGNTKISDSALETIKTQLIRRIE